MKNLTILMLIVMTTLVSCGSSIVGKYDVEIEVSDSNQAWLSKVEIFMELESDGTGTISMLIEDEKESDEIRYRVNESTVYISIDGGEEEIYYIQPDGRLVSVDDGTRTTLIKK